jgi:PAS domain S-box-containing protein
MYDKNRNLDKSKNILLLESHLPIINSISESLKRNGYLVQVVSKIPEEAAGFFSTILPDLILFNFSFINSSSGLKLYKHIHNELDIPIIMISDHQINSQHGINSLNDVYDILEVPIDPVKLLASVEIKLYKHKFSKYLEESENRSYALFNGNNAVMLLIDPVTGKIDDANRAAELFYGYSAIELRTMNINQINIKSIDEIQYEIKKIVNNERSHFYFQHKLATSDIRDVEINISPITFNGKTLLYSIIHDITQRKKSEEALIKRDERFKALIKTTGDGYFTAQQDGRLIETNDIFSNMLGFTKEEILSKHLKDFQAYETEPETNKHIENIISNGWDRFESKYRKSNDELIDVQVNAVFISTQSIFLCFVTDISHRKKSEETIRKSEESLRTVIENVDAILFTIDCDGIITMVEGSLLKTLGYESSDWVGKSVFQDFKETAGMISNVKESLKGVEVRKTIYIRNFFLKWSSKPQYDLDGEITGIIGMLFDLTKQVKQEMHIRKLSRAVEQSQVSIVITDSNGDIEYVNPKFTDVTGYTLDEAKGKNPRILKSGEQPEEVYKDLWSTITNGRQWSGIFHNKKKNGEMFWESANISPIVNENGKISNYIAVKEDITEKVEAENEIKRYHAKLEDLVEERSGQIKKQNVFFKTLIDTIPNPVFVKNTDGIYTEVNKAFAELLEEKRENILGKTVHEIPGGKTAELASQYDQELYKNHNKIIYETLLINKHGRKIPLLVYKASFGVSDRSPEGITGLVIDISRQKELEEHTLLALEKEKELNEMKTNFISMTSHEFRTPLTSILSSTDLLEMYFEKWPKEKTKNHLTKIQNSVLYMTDLLDKVLTISRGERGLFSFSPQNFNLETLCKETLVELKHLLTPLHSIKFEYLAEVKVIYADPKLIVHIINNLISNAIKYSPDGGEILFKVDFYGDKIKLIISDKGIGISDDEKHRLYEPFYRGKFSSSIKGSGLGLCVVKKAVELHSGKIDVESKFGEGSTFFVELSCNNGKQKYESENEIRLAVQ